MNRTIDRYIGNIVVFLAVISYFELFKFSVIPFTYRLLSQMFICALMLALIIIRQVYMPGVRIKMNFAVPVFILIVGSIPSYFIAYIYQDQNLISSLFANRIIWFYLLYFFLHVYQVQVSYILRLIIVTGLLAMILYFIQLYAFPKVVMDIKMLQDRGTLRLFVPGMLCTQAAYFYFLNQFFAKNKFFFLILSGLCISVFILQGTRQLIFALTFLTLVNLLYARRIQSRFLIIVILSLATFAIILIFRDIFIEINKISSLQAHHLGGGVRIKAARFFLTKFNPKFWAYIFGNSESGLNSTYNLKIAVYALKNGYYVSDIGIMGDFFKYGLIFTLAGIVMVVKAVGFRIGNEIQYLKYYLFSQCFTLISGTGILSGVDIILLMILYVFDVNRADSLQKNNPGSAAAESLKPNPQFVTQ